MDLEIKEIENKERWDGFITSCTQHSFLHSWAWGELNHGLGDKVWRLGIYKNEELIAAAMVVKVHARRGNFLFVPHGPVFAQSEHGNFKSQITSNKQISNYKFQILKTVTDYFIQLGKSENTSFIRVSPLLKDTEENREIFEELGYRSAPIYMHAETTWTIDLSKSEDGLMAEMRKNTRNLVRRAKKEGVEVKSGTSDDLIKDFLKLYNETAHKHGFTPFSEKFIRAQINHFGEEGIGIYIGYYNDTPVASAIIVFYGHSAYYHHGANTTNEKYKKIPASHLVQWSAITDAKNKGKQYYNFWGIAKDEENKSHPWYGLTLFKKGFGGFRTDYLHARDYKLNYKYWLSWAVDKYRIWKRGM